MRWIPLLLTSTAVCSLLLLGTLPACEETLEVCGPCGTVLSGDWTIVSEPRLDGTFESVQRLRHEAIQIDARFTAAVDRLAAAFNVTLPEDGDIAPLVDAMTALLIADGARVFESEVRLPSCFVDWETAMTAQNNCEDDLCSIDLQPGSGLCAGYLEGSCPTAESGSCFARAQDTCDGACIGLCAEMSEAECPGLCAGECDGACSAYDAEGGCFGVCSGLCSGQCESDTPFECNGVCNGECEVETVDGGCGDTDQFIGVCAAEASAGRCRGHLYPTGCGESCRSSCEEAAADCRETAKYLAWSGLSCDAGQVRFYADSSEAAKSALLQLRALERELSVVLSDYAWLSLAVDGYDLKEGDLSDRFKNNDVTALDDVMFDYLTSSDDEDISPAAPSRSTLPLESLKARLYWLNRALNADGGYRMTAGLFECLEPAIEDALYLLSRMVPSMEQTADDETQMVPDYDCETVTDSDTSYPMPPCLYRLMEQQAELLSLVLPES